jgi:predicted neuraminidase
MNGNFSELMALGCLVFLIGLATAQAEQPLFQTLVLAPSSPQGWFLNAYPVLDQLPSGRLVCVFAAAKNEKPAKMKIVVSTSDDGGKSWSNPSVLFDHPGMEDGDPNLIVDGDRILAFSTSNPVPGKIERTLIYGRESKDGINWSDEQLLKMPHRYINSKIHQGHRLSDGTLIMGYGWDAWTEQGMDPRTEGEMEMRSGVLRSQDGGKTWAPGADMDANVTKTSPNATAGLAEPATVVLSDGRVMALLRAGGTRLYQSWSSDGGLTWSQPVPSSLVAHNSPAALCNLKGSSDIVAVWDNSPSERHPLGAALSTDGGHTWSNPKVLTDSSGPQVSYPSVMSLADGTIIAAWQEALPQGGREIRMARFNRSWLMSK